MANGKWYTVSSEQKRKDLDTKWAVLTQNLKETNPDFHEPIVPFNNNILPKDFNSLYAAIFDRGTSEL